MIVVELAGPPRGKGRPRFSRKSGRVYTPAPTVSYEGALKHAAALVMRGSPPLEGALKVDVLAYMPVPASWTKKKRAAALNHEIYPTSKPDWENVAKMLDAFNEVVWRDDALIVTGTIRKRYSDRPRLVVEVEQVRGPA